MLRVADLFCGPGGMSQGLSMAGCKIVYGLDIDQAAITTFGRNYPEAIATREDALSLTPDSLPDFDILVGGPPCVNFSTSKGSRANVLEGLRLVQVFLRMVYERRPRYWIMENVPRIALHLPDSIPLSWIGIEKKGALPVPVRREFNSADFGVPQRRKRFLIGDYPIPTETHSDLEDQSLFPPKKNQKAWLKLRNVLEALPNINARRSEEFIRDPNYDIEISIDQLSDHFHEVLLRDEEAERIKQVKTEHPYMGRMVFPDDIDRPARTVVATQLGRETLVIEYRQDGKQAYRRATVRECATIQSFPITYQFWGNSLNARYRQVGDAVPPKLAFAIARQIVRKEEGKHLRKPQLCKNGISLSPEVKLIKKKRKTSTFPVDRKFQRMIPGKEVRGCRVDLDNQGNCPTKAIFTSENNLVEWVARLHVGEGKKNHKEKILTTFEALWEFSGYCGNKKESSEFKICVEFLEDAYRKLAGNLCDATTLQAIWTRRLNNLMGPEEISKILSSIVDNHFPKEIYENVHLPKSGRSDLVPARGLRIRIAAGCVVTAFACELVNCDYHWVEKYPKKRFVPNGWQSTTDIETSKIDSILHPLDTLKQIIEKKESLRSHQEETYGGNLFQNL